MTTAEVVWMPGGIIDSTSWDSGGYTVMKTAEVTSGPQQAAAMTPPGDLGKEQEPADRLIVASFFVGSFSFFCFSSSLHRWWQSWQHKVVAPQHQETR